MPPEAATPEDWLSLARRSHAFLQTIDDDFADMIVLHAQQCIEKSIKAVAWAVGQQPPFIHALDRLLAMLPPDIEVPGAVAQSVWLTETYIVTRYFADEPLPSETQVAEARTAADASVSWATTIVESTRA